MKLHKLFSAFVSKDPLKRALCGVYWDAEAMSLVVTDGHRMCMVTGEQTVEGPSAIIPLEAFKPTDKKSSENVRIVVAEGAETVEVIDPAGGTRRTMRTIDERYPDYRRVLPDARKYRGEKLPAVINGVYIAKILKALADQGPERCWRDVLLRFNGPFEPMIIELPNVQDHALTMFIMPVCDFGVSKQLSQEVYGCL